ncbi:riboflavin synthase [Persephonella sp.]
MFTGLIEEVGKITGIRHRSGGLSIDVKAEKILEDTEIGDSIAINGVCLTVTEIRDGGFSFDLSQETLNRTSFSKIKIGDYLNLERALKVSDRLGGHIVQGHVDTTGTIEGIQRSGDHTVLTIQFPLDFQDLVVEKGSIAVDGISLTINQVYNSRLKINIIPHTMESTNLRYRQIGDPVNLEFDILGKYVLNVLRRTGVVRSTGSLENLLDRF